MFPKHIDYPETPLQHIELREEAYGSGYVVSANDVDQQVEVWVDHPVGDARPALANLRLLPEDARRLAEHLLIALERIERQS